MGDQNVVKLEGDEHRKHFTQHLLNDIKAFDLLLHENKFEDEPIRIGAEQEVVLVGPDWMPSLNYDKFIDEANDPLLTTELGRFNLEINLPPFAFSTDALSRMHKLLDQKIEKLSAIGKKHNTQVLLTGILPTIHWDYLKFECMTPNPRYELINSLLKSNRKSNFEINIKGLDELLTSHPNILFEACNTSFQVHLQIPQNRFVEQYNWAQLIAGPVLAAACNSPLLMGKRLWSETRIALFQQSIDMRNSKYLKREIEPRVTFGRHWLKESASDYYKENVAHYNLLVSPEKLEDSIKIIQQGGVPKLPALNMHSGTVYSWNRACYGISDTGKPHLRIENRYLPAGPTVIDEMANTAFWLGVMMAMPPNFKNISQEISFEDVRHNFYNAAQHGIESTIKWEGKNVPVAQLILNKLLPWAHKGLATMNINKADIDLYLGIIEQRVKSKQTGAAWTRKNFTQLLNQSNKHEATTSITRQLAKMCARGNPVHQWPDVELNLGDAHKHFYTARHIMKTDIATLSENDIVDLAINFMVWKNVRYILVENSKHQLKGLLSSRRLIKMLREGWKDGLGIKEIMEENVICVSPNTTTQDAIQLMIDKNIGCLPVVSDSRLLGMITERDIVNVAHKTQKFNL